MDWNALALSMATLDEWTNMELAAMTMHRPGADWFRAEHYRKQAGYDCLALDRELRDGR